MCNAAPQRLPKSNWYQPSKNRKKEKNRKGKPSIHPEIPSQKSPSNPTHSPIRPRQFNNLQSHMPNQLNTSLQFFLHIRNLLLQRHVLHSQSLHHRPRRTIAA